MPNTLSYGQVLTRKMLAVLTSNCPVTRSLNHDYEKVFPDGGYDGQKAGPTIYIRKPTQRIVRRTWPMGTAAITETTVALTPDQVFGTDLAFSDLELATKVDDYFERYVAPDIKKVAAAVESYNINYMLNAIYNCEAYTSLAIPTTMAQGIMTLRAKLINNLCPVDGQNFAVSPLFEASIIPALAGQYNPQSNISEMYVKGQMSNAVGLDWYSSQNLPGIIIGSQTNATPIVGAYNSTANTSLPYTGAGVANGTVVAGQCFTIAGLYDVNYESKVPYSQLKQFVVTAANTAVGGAGTLTVSPAINYDTTDPAQNCYIAAGTIVGAAIVYGCLYGVTAEATTASQIYQQDLMCHRDSFAWAGVPLEIPAKAEVAGVATDDRTGLSIRYIKMYDINNARMLNRIDVLGGICALYPQWAGKFWTV